MHEQGETCKEIAQKFGFSVSTVNYHLNPKVKEGAKRRIKRNPNYRKKEDPLFRIYERLYAGKAYS